MGFLCVAIKLPKCINLIPFLLCTFKFMFITTLTSLGLLKPVQEQDSNSSSTENVSSYVLVTEGPNPSIVTIPIQVLISLIKKRLPVVEYQRFGTDEDHTVCVVCLDSIESSQEIRELRNCDHVFHRDCLDTWVDEGQVTCPLCRSLLFPGKGEKLRGPWILN